MQFLIKDYEDSEKRKYVDIFKYILVIEDDCLIVKVNRKMQTNNKYIELYRKSFIGWHNIQFDGSKYVMDSGKIISIDSDILTNDSGEYHLRHFNLSFIPLQVHNLEEFFNYLNKVNRVKFNDEQLRIVEQFKIQELEAKQREEERIKQIKLQEIEARQREEEKRKAIEFEILKAEQLAIQNFLNMVNIIKEDRELEKIFLNYFNKYVNHLFLSPICYMSMASNLLNGNGLYERVKKYVPTIYSNTFDNPHLILYQIDMMVEFMSNKISNSNKDLAKLLTWVEICDTAMTYYSNCFYEQHGKQIGNIDNINLTECIYKYIHLDIIADNEEIRGMFVYYLMSLSKFENSDLDKGYIYCREIFTDIFEKLRSESEYDNFINSLSIDDQADKINYTINDVDLMAGSEFEIFVGELFKKMEYKTIVTKASGDQGIDVVAEKNGLRYGIQAKCYSNVVSNSAVQEVVAGLSFYKCDKAIVITNNYFTNSAIELARVNGVVLWDREMLKQKIYDFFYII